MRGTAIEIVVLGEDVRPRDVRAETVSTTTM